MSHVASAPVALTDKNFAETIQNADQPVLVDFWAEWCGPCRMLGPVIESLSEAYAGKATVAKVDVDANQAVAMQFGIRSIPTVMLFDKGQVVETFVGVRPESDYRQGLDKLEGDRAFVAGEALATECIELRVRWRGRLARDDPGPRTRAV